MTGGSGGGGRGKDVEQGEVQRQEKEVKEAFDDGERTAGERRRWKKCAKWRQE